jgi:hypothetical protein
VSQLRNWVAPIDRADDILVSITLELGQTLDDGSVVSYERWKDLVFRYNPANSDGSAFQQVC